MGMSVFVFYICALGFYLWIRIAKTLDLGQYLGYGIFVLCVEVMGATTVILYGTNLLWNPVNEIVLQESEDGVGPGKLKVKFRCDSPQQKPFVCWVSHNLSFVTPSQAMCLCDNNDIAVALLCDLGISLNRHVLVWNNSPLLQLPNPVSTALTSCPDKSTGEVAIPCACAGALLQGVPRDSEAHHHGGL